MTCCAVWLAIAIAIPLWPIAAVDVVGLVACGILAVVLRRRGLRMARHLFLMTVLAFLFAIMALEPAAPSYPPIVHLYLVVVAVAAYVLLRRYGGPGADKLGAGMALFGMANVPFVFISVNVWRTLHPMTSVVPTLPVDMGGPLWFCVVAFFLLFLVLMNLRARLEHQRVRIEELFLAEDEA